MADREFSKKCGRCKQRAVEIADVPFSLEVDHDGRRYPVSIRSLSVPKCANCGEFSIDAVAEKQIDGAFRSVAGLLPPEAIRSGRQHLSLTQQQLADTLGIAVTTISRWENGYQVQQRFHDRILRAFFAMPGLRVFLAGLNGEHASGPEQPPVEAQNTTAQTLATLTGAGLDEDRSERT
jgi:DNA-binding transcriptional regulator YiaG